MLQNLLILLVNQLRSVVEIILLLYSTIGVSYLLGHRVWIWYHRRQYVRIIEEAKITSPLAIEEVGEQSAVTLAYERAFVESESVEEREYRIEQDYYTRTGKMREEA